MLPSLVSVVIPTYNEEAFVQALLRNLQEQDYPADRLELLFVDGQSTDATRTRLLEAQRELPSIQVIDNPERYVPYAMNHGIARAKGEFIVRMDAHSIYPRNYISRLVQALVEMQAANVGGMWVTRPGNASVEAAAIAIATADRFGIGDAMYRLGGDAVRLVDTVPFGCYRRSLFDEIGPFDTDLLRNQDDELNGRIRKRGDPIYLLPDVKIEYFARATLSKMRTMFYQYGEYKPLVMLKLGAPATVRQFAPPALVLLHLAALPLLLFARPIGLLAAAAIATYYALVLLRAWQLSDGASGTTPGSRLSRFGYLVQCFPSIHFSYGLGYVAGWWRFVIRRQHEARTGRRISESR